MYGYVTVYKKFTHRIYQNLSKIINPIILHGKQLINNDNIPVIYPLNVCEVLGK